MNKNIIEDEPEDDDTEELYQSVFIKPRKRALLPGSNISFHKQFSIFCVMLYCAENGMFLAR